MNLQKRMGDGIMLLQFRFKNYMSFKDEAILDMTATSIKEHQDTLIEVNGNKILPVAAVYGANASGKSNIFGAFYAMKRDVLKWNVEENHYYIVPFVFGKNLIDEPSEFEVCILIGEKEYRYGFARDYKTVQEEWLFEKKFSSNKVKEKCIYYRNSNKLIKSETNQREKKEINFTFSMTTESELLLSNLGKRKVSKYCIIYEWFSLTSTVCNFSRDDEEDMLVQVATEMLYENQNQEYPLYDDILSLLKEFDEAIKGIKIEKEKSRNEEEYNVFIIHECEDGETIKYPLNAESSGTIKLFSLAAWLIFAIEHGEVLFVDELDARLHPLVLRYIVRLFTDKEKNIGNGQIIFSAHNLICLNSTDLRRDEIWFVEKNNQQSRLYSLYDFKEDESVIRSDLNFGKNYLSGRFGAIPYQD